MSGFLGSYHHQVDDKGRLSLPAAFRRETSSAPFVLAQAFPDSLALFPAATWAEVEDRLRGLLRSDPAARSWFLGVTANAVEVVPDRQGRILIPQRLQEAAGIDGSALVVGAIDRIELWDPDRFEASVTPPSEDTTRFTHIFG